MRGRSGDGEQVGNALIRVAVDATPLAGRRTGIGHYVARLTAELARAEDVELSAAMFSLRGRQALGTLPDGVRAIHRPVPARLLQRAWLRGRHPSAETVMGRADVVHGTNFVLPPPRRGAGVLTVQDLSFVRYPELVDRASLAYRELVPRGIRWARMVIAPTRAIAAEIADTYRVEPERLAVTPLGVDAEWFALHDRPPELPSEYLLAVGTLEPRKGLEVLVSAYRELLAGSSDTPPLVLVGPAGWGPKLDLQDLAPGRVILTGYVSDRALRSIVAHAQLLAYPSRYEGFGLPPLEALAAGTPVVASDLAPIREVVGSHATLVPPGDVSALAAALSDTLAHPPTATAVAAGQEHAATFTWAACAASTVASYRRALGGDLSGR